MAQYDFAVIGGDKRIACMIPLLEKKGYRVISYGIQEIKSRNEGGRAAKTSESLNQAIENADAVIGGFPMIKMDQLVMKDSIKPVSSQELLGCLNENQRLFAGMLPESFRERCRERKISCYDFMAEETLAIYNAIATGEGAILEAMKNKETNLHGSQCLVLGYGRCGRVLCDKLKGLSARVTLASGKSGTMAEKKAMAEEKAMAEGKAMTEEKAMVDEKAMAEGKAMTEEKAMAEKKAMADDKERAEAEAIGFETLPLSQLREEIGRFEYIFNTIPALVLTGGILEGMAEDALIIDIASVPGGVDYEAARRLGIQAHHCLGIPGRYAPRTSAVYLADYVDKITRAY